MLMKKTVAVTTVDICTRVCIYSNVIIFFRYSKQ